MPSLNIKTLDFRTISLQAGEMDFQDTSRRAS